MKSPAPAVLLGALVWCVLGCSACYSPTLPLPPPSRDGLTVSPPNEEGEVLVRGEPTVMDAGEQAVIINTNTLYGWIVPVDDAGFEVWIQARSGHILAIHRRIADEVGPAVELVVPEPAPASSTP